MIVYGIVAFLVVAVAAFGFQYSRYTDSQRDK